jgi:hypothetical protein
MSILIRFILSITLIISISNLGMAQKGSSAAPPAPKKKASNVGETCDGALDIVPAKSMTFVRKRRPNKNDKKQPDVPPKNEERHGRNEK